MRLIPVSALKLGSIVALDVIDANGVATIKKGQTVTQNAIDSLNMLCVSSVYITDRYCFIDEKQRINTTSNMESIYHHIVAIQSVAKRIQEGNTGVAEFEKLANITTQIVTDFMIIKDDIKIVFEPAKVRSNALIERTMYVAMMSVALGVKMGLSAAQLGELCTVGLMCNFALISPKFAEICPDPKELQRIHTKLAHDYLKANYEIPAGVLEGILHSNELYDGTGCPSGLKGDEISIYASIHGIIDFYYELKSNPANAAMGQQIFDIMFKSAMKRFDPKVSEVFLKNIQYYNLDTIIRLENGDIGVVVGTNNHRPFRPIIRVVTSTLFPKDFLIDLAVYEFKIGAVLHYID